MDSKVLRLAGIAHGVHPLDWPDCVHSGRGKPGADGSTALTSWAVIAEVVPCPLGIAANRGKVTALLQTGKLRQHVPREAEPLDICAVTLTLGHCSFLLVCMGH